MLPRLSIILTIFLAISGLPLTVHAQSKIKIITTLRELAEVANAIGGDRVEATALLSGNEDPHFVEASPRYIQKVADADVVCFVGLELEIGWLPKVLAKSGNVKVQQGGAGYCETGRSVTVIEKPTGAVDRSGGDTHPQGNPHFNLSPIALGQAAETIAEILIAQRPVDRALFESRLKSFQAKMKDLVREIQILLGPFVTAAAGRPWLIEYHKEFSYFFDLYKLKSLGSIEEKPGVQPSLGRLNEISEKARTGGVKLALASLSTPEKHLRRFSELSGVPVVRTPANVDSGNSSTDSIAGLQRALAKEILKAWKP